MRHALVMGATGSIGAAICEELAQKGFSLYLHYGENKEKAKNLQKSLEIRYPKQDFFVVSLKMDKLLENDLEIFVKKTFFLRYHCLCSRKKLVWSFKRNARRKDG